MSQRPGSLLATEIALWAVTAMALVGMHRLFDGAYLAPLILQAIVAHAVVAVLRRRGVRVPLAAAITLMAAVLAITWAFYGQTAVWLLPTGDTLTALGHDLDVAWQTFRDVKAPAPVEDGFLVVTSATIWMVVFVADWAAFRTGAAFEAVLPGATLFIFAAALGHDGGRIPSTMGFALAAMVFLLVHRTMTQEDHAVWAASHHRRGRWSLLGSGAALIVVAVSAGAFTGSRLPSGEDAALVPWRNLDDREETRVVPSPMVDIRTHLVEQPDVEVFTVRADQGRYWRLTSLDDFDGRIWRSSYSTDNADGDLPRDFDETRAETETMTQQVDVTGLAEVWLPGAWEPIALDPGDGEVDYDQRSGTLIVDKARATSDGMTYELTSEVPQWTREELQSAGTDVPDEIRERYLGLPHDFSGEIIDDAQDITQGLESPYAKALALQDFFRGPNSDFEYDLEVGEGHGSAELADFLYRTKRGYCEQFAGAFGAMARAVGLPTRVVVGFTQGIQDPADPTIFRVRGRHAHAWAEVYLDGFGWVTFDPTPGRGQIGAEDYLGVIPAQAPPEGSGETAVTVPTQEGATGLEGNPNAGELPSFDERLGAAQTAAGAQRDSQPLIPEQVKLVGKSVGIGALLYLVLVPLLILVVHLVRRRRARTPADRVRLAWRESTDRLVEVGVPLPASATITERSERAAATLPETATSIALVARAMEHVAYADTPLPPEHAAEIDSAWHAIVAAVRRQEPWWRRVLRYFDVRQLQRSGSRVVRRSAHGAVRSTGPR